MARTTREQAAALGLERLTEYRAAEGAYEKWLAEEGVPLLFVYEPPPITKDPATGLPSFDLGRSPLAPPDVERAESWYNPDHEHAYVPEWVNVLGRALRGQKLVDAIHAALRDEPLAQALAAAYALGGQPAVEALLLRDREAA